MPCATPEHMKNNSSDSKIAWKSSAYKNRPKKIYAVAIFVNLIQLSCKLFLLLTVMESSRTCPWPRGSSMTHFQVFGLEIQVSGLGLVLIGQ